MATTEEKFLSAVEIIRNLPKSGFVKPSNGTKLKFYSYFKQATEGPCELPKPGFWDVINRAKWDAWAKLGNMSKEEAMRNYVQAFVDTMQQYSVDDLEDPNVLDEYSSMIAPFLEYAPPEMRETLVKKPLNNNNMPKDTSNGPLNGHNLNGNDSDSDEFSDTLDMVQDVRAFASASAIECTNGKGGPPIVNVRGGGSDPRKPGEPSSGGSGGRGNPTPRYTGGDNSRSLQTGSTSAGAATSGGGGAPGNPGQVPEDIQGEVGAQLAVAIIRMQHSMEQVVTRLEALETLLKQKTQVSRPTRFFGINPKLAILILAWPFIAQWIIYYVRKRQRHG